MHETVSTGSHVCHLRVSLGDSSRLNRNATATAAALGVCVILIGALPIPLKRIEVEARGTTLWHDPVAQRVAGNPDATVAAHRAPLPRNCTTPVKILTIALLGSFGFIKCHTKDS